MASLVGAPPRGEAHPESQEAAGCPIGFWSGLPFMFLCHNMHTII
jgi:hypothetical protein